MLDNWPFERERMLLLLTGVLHTLLWSWKAAALLIAVLFVFFLICCRASVCKRCDWSRVTFCLCSPHRLYQCQARSVLWGEVAKRDGAQSPANRLTFDKTQTRGALTLIIKYFLAIFAKECFFNSKKSYILSRMIQYVSLKSAFPEDGCVICRLSEIVTG